MTETDTENALIQDLRKGKQDRFAEIFSGLKERLKRIVRFRLDFRLASRISDSDVIQETFVRAAARLDRFLENPDYPFFVWLRMQVNQQVADLHRKHLMAEKRDARREIELKPNAAGSASNQTSVALAAHLVANLTSPSRIVERYEQITALEKSLNEMNDIDREVIALRHFEELSSQETAQVLNIEPAAASKRYVRALQRLKEIMKQHGFTREATG